MQTKTIALFALSVSAVLASPFHKRQHHHFHGTGTGRPSGTGRGHIGNDTNAPFAPRTSSGTAMLTMTVSPFPVEASSGVVISSAAGNLANNANAVASTTTSCTSTTVITETSVRIVTVSASDAPLGADQINGGAVNTIATIGQVGAGQFYGSKSYNGGYSQAPAPSPQPSTTFATVVSSSQASGASSAPVSSSAPSTGNSGNKRGISFNSASSVSAFGNSVSWAYNWGTGGNNLPSGVEFVPMCWGPDQVAGFASKIGSATHVLSFNEPDQDGQAVMDPQTAASKHKQVFTNLKGKVQIGSPAVTNGVGTSSSPMGLAYLEQFFNACGSDCPVDFVAYHWYSGAQYFADFKQHTQDVINLAAKYGVNKVWLTEFAPSGSADAMASFMKQAVSFLDSTPAVERYAAFMASDGTLLSGSGLNSVGSAYAAAS